MVVAAAVDLADLRVCLSLDRFLGCGGTGAGVLILDLFLDPLGRPRFLWRGVGESGGVTLGLLGEPAGRPRGRLTCEGVNLL